NPNRPSYDLNGNILNLLRSGKTAEVDGLVTYGAMDNLVYSYDGNRLLKVTESAVTTEGFKDGSNEGNDYGYDDNGNMIIDLNKGIGTSLEDLSNKITYNHLNLPQRVQKSPTAYIDYIYDATGRKLRQVAVENDRTKITDYAGEF